jgi:hypothetical protein
MSLFGIFQQNGSFWVPGWLFYVSCFVWGMFFFSFLVCIAILILLLTSKRDIPGLTGSKPDDSHFPPITYPKPALKPKPASRRRRKL